MIKTHKNIFIVVIGILFTLLQLPFINADPDIHLSESRGANTDEGLNSCQIRNFINHGDLTIDKSDNFVKTPLFGAALYIPFKLFGTKLPVGRSFVFLLSLLLLLFFIYNSSFSKTLTIISFAVVFTQYYIFHFFHFCLAEMASTILILSSILFTISFKKENIILQTAITTGLIAIAYYLKIQFLYAAIIPLILSIVFKFKSNNRTKYILFTLLFTLLYLLLYYIAWYLPHKDLLNYVMLDQTSGRFVSYTKFLTHLKFVFNHIFLNNYLKVFTFSFIILYPLGFYLFKSQSQNYKTLFIALSCWLLVEFHKTFMLYLPTRYFVGLFIPLFLLIALILTELWKMNFKFKQIPILKAIAALFVFVLVSVNIFSYTKSLNNRSFVIKDVNQYLEKYDLKNSTIIGSWAPTLTWNCKAKSYPVWFNYFNSDSIVEKHDPIIIIAEKDENDSGQAFISNGINLKSISDSTLNFTVNQWNINLFWINKK